MWILLQANESVKKKLEEYFDNDLALKRAFAEDAAILKSHEDDDNMPGPEREEFVQARAGLPLKKLPLPIEDCDIDILRAYLKKELFQLYLNTGGKRRRRSKPQPSQTPTQCWNIQWGNIGD